MPIQFAMPERSSKCSIAFYAHLGSFIDIKLILSNRAYSIKCHFITKISCVEYTSLSSFVRLKDMVDHQHRIKPWVTLPTTV